MARIDTTGLTLDNGATRELAKLIFDEIIYSPSLSESFTLLFGQRNGEEVTFIGDFGLMAKGAQGCNPEYNDTLLPARGQKWNIAKWGIYEKICVDEIEQILRQYNLRVDRFGDLSGNPYLTEIIIPRLEWAIRNELQRIAWFGDENDLQAYKNEEMVPYFSVVDGFWARLYLDAITLPQNRKYNYTRVEIAANNQSTTAAQISAMQAAGVATGIIDQMITAASPELRAAEGVIYMSLKMKDALEFDLQKNNRGSNLQWESLRDGVQATYYQGIRVVVLPIWDKVINSFLANGENPNALFLPYRAIYTTKANLLVGTTSEREIEEVDVFYVEKDEATYIRAKDSIGTMIADPNMIVSAF